VVRAVFLLVVFRLVFFVVFLFVAIAANHSLVDP